MPVPNLINFVDVTVEQIDRAGTLRDPDSREPIQAAARKTSVTLKGRPKWQSSREMDRELQQGITDGSRGYVLFRVVDLEALKAAGAMQELDFGDRMIGVGNAPGSTTNEVYIIRLQPTAYWADQRGHTLIRAWFLDRLPSKQR